jgi:hypothetical protein
MSPYIFLLADVSHKNKEDVVQGFKKTNCAITRSENSS